MEMCPVCTKESAKKRISGVIDGVIYYFCCSECKNNFMAEPRRYINCCDKIKPEVKQFREQKGESNVT